MIVRDGGHVEVNAVSIYKGWQLWGINHTGH